MIPMARDRAKSYLGTDSARRYRLKEYVPSKMKKGQDHRTRRQPGKKDAGEPAKATSLKSKEKYASRGTVALANLTPLAIVFRSIRPSWRNYVDYVRMAVREGDSRA